MKKGCWTSQVLKKHANETTQLHVYTTLHKKGRLNRGGKLGGQRVELRTTEDLSQAWKLNGVCAAGFQN